MSPTHPRIYPPQPNLNNNNNKKTQSFGLDEIYDGTCEAVGEKYIDVEYLPLKQTGQSTIRVIHCYVKMWLGVEAHKQNTGHHAPANEMTI